ncbi:hypothetical protein G1C97_0502 [Bifidobacterium sp. DSM 109959]|uniref:Uncharacterized protein n=1 Tax=Bifidobacterium olomucense TaxID=2675324 RepID=A0A7Y0EW78_9BIFI|nr:hypothetical protein [Bifidobacterium sp. DSM 109959]
MARTSRQWSDEEPAPAIIPDHPRSPSSSSVVVLMLGCGSHHLLLGSYRARRFSKIQDHPRSSLHSSSVRTQTTRAAYPQSPVACSGGVERGRATLPSCMWGVARLVRRGSCRDSPGLLPRAGASARRRPVLVGAWCGARLVWGAPLHSAAAPLPTDRRAVVRSPSPRHRHCHRHRHCQYAGRRVSRGRTSWARWLVPAGPRACTGSCPSACRTRA